METLKLNKLVEHINQLGLDVSVGEDEFGEIIIYTGVRCDRQENLILIEDDEYV